MAGYCWYLVGCSRCGQQRDVLPYHSRQRCWMRTTPTPTPTLLYLVDLYTVSALIHHASSFNIARLDFLPLYQMLLQGSDRDLTGGDL